MLRQAVEQQCPRQVSPKKRCAPSTSASDLLAPTRARDQGGARERSHWNAQQSSPCHEANGDPRVEPSETIVLEQNRLLCAGNQAGTRGGEHQAKRSAERLPHAHLQIDADSAEESKCARIGRYIRASFHGDVRLTKMIGREEARLECEHHIGLVGATTEALIADTHESRAHKTYGRSSQRYPGQNL